MLKDFWPIKRSYASTISLFAPMLFIIFCKYFLMYINKLKIILHEFLTLIYFNIKNLS